MKLLLPLAWLYGLITSLRNYLYDIGHYRSAKFETPIICVGNLAVGGSGKTPMTEYLIRHLNNKKIGVLSRGYKRKTKGFRLASARDDAASIGDEPYQLFLKFKEIPIAVSEERALGAAELLHAEACEAIVLDDGFQHRAITPFFSILLTDCEKPFTEDYLLPAGRLRESRKGAKRAHAIVVTKCPDLSQDRRNEISKAIQKYTQAPVFFAKIHYSPLAAFGNGEARSKAVLVSGLANASSFKSYCESRFEAVRHFDFPDHYSYSSNDIRQIEELATASEAMIVTTEKDYVKLMKNVSYRDWFYLPIEIKFLDFENEFLALTNLALWRK